ncbi:MAG: flagellar protein FlaG [Rhizobiales bacterium]|nr:flagellar protein FlaG [Hyphomicrobiales bacterium]
MACSKCWRFLGERSAGWLIGAFSILRLAPKAADQPLVDRVQLRLDAEIDEADLQKAEQLRAFVASENFSLRAYHDEESGRQIIEVRDQTTGDVVTQYPSEELVRLYTSLRQSLVDQRA